MAWTLEYHRLGAVVRLSVPDEIEAWAVMDYLAANFQRPNRAADARLDALTKKQEWAARVAGAPSKGKR